MLWRIIVAAAIGALVYAVCLLLGPILAETHTPIISTVGDWLKQFAVLFGVIAAVLWFASGRTIGGIGKVV